MTEKKTIREIAISHQRQMSSVHPHAIIGTIEDAIEEYAAQQSDEIAELKKSVNLLHEAMVTAEKRGHDKAMEEVAQQSKMSEPSIDEIKEEGLKYLKSKYPDKKILSFPELMGWDDFADFAIGYQIGFAVQKDGSSG